MLYWFLNHIFWFPDQTPTPTRFLKNCEEVGLFSELDCSIEQEFCKAQEEEDSKQVQSGEQRAGLNNKNPLQGSGGSGLLSGAIISHAILKAPSSTWTFNRLRDLVCTLRPHVDRRRRVCIYDEQQLFFQIWVTWRPPNAPLQPCQQSQTGQAAADLPPRHMWVEKSSSSTPVTSNSPSSLRTGVRFLPRMQLLWQKLKPCPQILWHEQKNLHTTNLSVCFLMPGP